MKKGFNLWTMMAVVFVLAVMSGQFVKAAALTEARDTPERSGELVALVVKASNTIYAGSMVAVDTAAGTVVPATDAAARVVLGRADATALAGETIEVRRGVFRWVNSGSFTAAHIGQFAYVADAESVTTAAIATNDVIAGVIVDVDTLGVWVDSYAVPAQAAATLASLTVTGNAAVGGTLAVTGASTLGGTAAITGNATVGGTLSVTGVVTLVAAPKLTATTTAGTNTVTMTTAPAAGNPVWATVSVGTNSYVVPLFPAQ